MDRRLKLHEILCEILGSRYVYFQPPESKKIKFPCIIYERNNGDTEYAGNNPYRFQVSYKVTLVDRDPDNDALLGLASLPMSRFDRHYVSDNLNHDVFNIYY